MSKGKKRPQKGQKNERQTVTLELSVYEKACLACFILPALDVLGGWLVKASKIILALVSVFAA